MLSITNPHQPGLWCPAHIDHHTKAEQDRNALHTRLLEPGQPDKAEPRFALSPRSHQQWFLICLQE